jgi:Lon protease-like protein
MGEVEDLPPLPRVRVPLEYALLADILERLMPELGAEYAALPADYQDAGWVGARLAEVLSMEPFERQALLEVDDPVARLAQLMPLVRGAN